MLRAVSAFVLAAVTVTWPAAPPLPPAHPVITNYFGTRVVDPYRYFENPSSPVVQRFFRSEANYTNAVLARLGPGREALRKNIARLVDAGETVYSVVLVGNQYFYLDRPVGVDDARLMVRDAAPGSQPRLLVDPDAMAKAAGVSAHYTISAILPSYDGKRIAYTIVPGGAEDKTTLYVVDVASGKTLPDSVPRAWFGATAWSQDGTSFYYNQLIELKPGQPITDKERYSKLKEHVIGTDPSKDPILLGTGVDPNVPFAPDDAPSITVSPASTWAIAENQHGVQNEVTLYAAPVASLHQTPIPWRKIVDIPDAVTGFDLRGDTIYLLNHKGASHYQVAALDLSQPNAVATTAKTIVPASTAVIQQVAVAKDALYVRGILGGLAQLRKLPWSAGGTAGPIANVALPFAGTMAQLATDPRIDGGVVGFASWTRPLLFYQLAPSGTLADTGLRKPPAIDTSPYTSMEVTVPSTGGAMVPLSIVMRKGTKLDGSAPAYLEGYGSYGLDIDPYFLGSRFAWLDAGGIWAVVHVRGGGEYGEEWHVAGKGPLKQHTIDDGVAAARYLIAHRYTSASHLSVEGTSAGGIFVGGLVTQHPELFAAALDVVGVTDALRSEVEPNGPSNVVEFGSSKTRAGFRDLYLVDAYVHVKNGVRYPAVMGVTGINDPRVAPWQVAKFVARLQQASSSGRPVLLRVDYDSGHGLLGASRAQTVATLTDEFSFLLWQSKSPQFAGIPTNIAAH